MNWKYLLTLILVVAAVGAFALVALESAPRPEVSGKVIAQSPIDGVAVPGTNGKVMAYPNGVYAIQPENFGVSTPLRDIPDRDEETIAKELATPSWKTLAKQKRINEVNAGRAQKGLPPMDENALAEFEINEQNSKVIKRTKPGMGADAGDGNFVDPLVEKGQIDLNAPQAMPTPSLTFNGATSADNAAVGVGGLSPPDTNGDVGPNHYVSSVNLAMKIFDKSGNVIGTPKKTSDLWAGLPSTDPCRTRNDGDPIVIYDQFADRWHISQFAVPAGAAGTAGSNFQCVAVSTTGDPTGSYYLWSYTYPGQIFNDYPKVGMWTDAYHMTFNQFNNAGTSFLGAGFFSQDRAKALAGDPTASAVYKNIAPVDPDAGGILPPDIEGWVPPPAGMAAVFSEFRADEFGDPVDGIRNYKWVPNFADPASSVFAVLPDVTLAAFDARQPSGRTDIEQSGGSSLDSISDRVMHRLAYRNLGTPAAPINSIVGNFTVNVGGVNPTSAATYQAGIRWFELRRTGDTFSVFDQGTLVSGAVDPAAGKNNWMGSITTDSQGNLALGFSQSSTTQDADIRIAGRTGAPTGALNEGEAMFFDATGSQTGSNRWGDYSMMSVDPSDDCTFWYTQEYYSASSSVSWSTRVGKFKYPGCTAAPTGTISGTITSCSSGLPVQGANVTATGGFQRLSIANGTYSMIVAPGPYTVNADKAPGFFGSSLGVNVPSGGNATANICLTGVPVLSAGTSAIVTESCGLPNGVPDPGETLSVSLPLVNNGGAATTNLTATLQATGGVTNPGPAQSYGALAASGGTDTKNFSFTAAPGTTCGSNITLTWNLQDGVTNLGTVVKVFGTGTPVVNVNQNFDGVTAPALPAGWTTSQAGSGTLWVTSTTSPIGAPNSAFTTDPATTGEASLETPAFNVSSSTAKLEFDITHTTENNFDGVVVEIQIGAGSYQDIVTAGGSFVQNGYNGTLGNFSGCSATPNPLANRPAYTGTATTPKHVIANLPASANGQSVKIRWRMGSDCSVGGTGARVDNVQVIAGVACNGPCAPARSVRADYDGDGRTDVSIWRPSTGTFWVNRTTDGPAGIQWGANGDYAMGGDTNGDRKTDHIINRPTTPIEPADFWILHSPSYAFIGYAWGVPGDKPAIRDFTGDGVDDFAVWRESDTNFYILAPNDPNPVRVFQFGSVGDKPFVGDFSGDSKAEIAVYRPSTGVWYIAAASGNPATQFTALQFGISTDKPVPADYDGDGKDDVAVFRPSTGVWYIYRSSDQQVQIVQFGTSTDIPVPGDYDGDGKYDIAIFRNGEWWILRSSNSTVQVQQWGLAGDQPIPASYLPQ